LAVENCGWGLEVEAISGSVVEEFFEPADLMV
jgi:hypothetical protein